MKRTVIGFALLLTLLGAGLVSTRYLDQCHQPAAALLAQAGEAAAAGNWEQARDRLEQARQNWLRHWHRAACFYDHEPMEQIDAGFVRLEVLARHRDGIGFAAAAGELAAQVEALADGHSLNWWTLL